MKKPILFSIAAFLLFSISASAQLSKILPSNHVGQQIKFGQTLDISSDYLAIGALDDANAPGQNVDAAVYIFKKSGNAWTQEAKLKPSTGILQNFVSSVALVDDIIAVGSEDINVGGSTFIFGRSGSNWSQLAEVKPPSGQKLTTFGSAVDFSKIGNEYHLFIGNSRESAGSANSSGAVYVYTSTNKSTWTFKQKLVHPSPTSFNYMGQNMDCDGSQVIIGTQADGQAGSALIFNYSNGSWTLASTLTSNDGVDFDFFGTAVELAGNYAVVGASGDDDNGTDSGSAYVFSKSGSNWTQIAKISYADGNNYDSFGTSVGMSGDVIIVGASSDQVGTFQWAGSCHTFTKSGNTWSPTSTFGSTDPNTSEAFGGKISVSNGVAVISAVGDNQLGTKMGAVYSLTINTSSTKEQELLATKVELYPNPVSNDLIIELNGLNAKDVKVRIVDIQGRFVSNVNLESTKTSVDVSNLISGNYLLELSSDNVTVGKQFVKK